MFPETPDRHRGGAAVAAAGKAAFTAALGRPFELAQPGTLGLLARALELVKPGGRVVYSTCSLLRDENEDVVVASGAEVEDLTHAFPGMASPDLPGALRLLPHVNGTDGFFVARLTGR